MKLLLPLHEIPPVLRESIRCCLAAHGMTLSEPLVVELGNNLAQALISIDEAEDMLETLAAHEAKLDALALIVRDCGRAVQLAADPDRRDDPVVHAFVAELTARVEAALPRTKA